MTCQEIMRRYPNYINLYNGFTLGYEQDVEVHETQDVIILLCGIMWEQSIEQFESLQELKIQRSILCNP